MGNEKPRPAAQQDLAFLLEIVPNKELHIEQFTMACNLQYPDLDNHNNNRYEDDYSQLSTEALCL